MEVLLAKSWAGQDPTGWWMSEKLDGVRAVWDGKTREFYSRNGNRFHAPEWFRAAMPATSLDGELFIGRGKFQETVSIVRTQGEDKGWNKIKFHAFDVYPFDADSAVLSFEERQEWLAKIAATTTAEIVHVQQHACEGADHVNAFVDAVVAAGGEGAMLRMPGSLYERKRSGTLLKV